MVRAKLVIPVVALVCFLTAPLRAQEFRAFVMGTGSFLENEHFFTNANQRYRSNYAPGGKVIFGGEFPLSSIVGVEGSYGYGRNNLRVTDLGTSETVGFGVRI